MNKQIYKKGFTLVEIVVGVAICLIVLIGLMNAFTITLKLSLANTSKIQASFLEEEGLEAARILRDNGWTANIATLTPDTTYYLAYNNNTWQTTSTNSYIDSFFERKIVTSNVNRDSNQNIVSSGGTLDPNIRKITISVSWLSGGATTTKSISTYLTNVFNN